MCAPDTSLLPAQRQRILNLLREAEIPIFLIKLQRNGLSFGVDSELAARACQTLEAHGFRVSVKPRRVMVSIFAQNMRELHGVIARIAEVLYEAGVAIEQMSDAHNRITCLIEAERAAGRRAAVRGVRAVAADPTEAARRACSGGTLKCRYALQWLD